MKRTKVIVPWREGLHLRPAARLVNLGKVFRSAICLKYGQKTADLHSIISIISLCATMGTALDVEISGDDEHEAVRAVEGAFSVQANSNAPAPGLERNATNRTSQ